jgi:hypothetical protein
MNTVLNLLLALLTPAAPALKTEKPPRDLIDLLPEDTAAVLVLDVPKLAAHPVGARLFECLAKLLPAREAPFLPVADIVKETEVLIIAQFGIESRVGDFCLVMRLKDGATVPKTLLARALAEGGDPAGRLVGNRTVHEIAAEAITMCILHSRTLMVVLACGHGNQQTETVQAAYAERETPGPKDPTLRKMLAELWPADRPVLLYGSHPKVCYSVGLALGPLGTGPDTFTDLGTDVISFRGSVGLGKTANAEVRVKLRDAATAREFGRRIRTSTATFSGQGALEQVTAVMVEKDDVVVKARLTADVVGRLFTID